MAWMQTSLDAGSRTIRDNTRKAAAFVIRPSRGDITCARETINQDWY
jgi:hypothetical protein